MPLVCWCSGSTAGAQPAGGPGSPAGRIEVHGGRGVAATQRTVTPQSTGSTPSDRPNALVAQWTAHRFPEPGVAGSSPAKGACHHESPCSSTDRVPAYEAGGGSSILSRGTTTARVAQRIERRFPRPGPCGFEPRRGHGRRQRLASRRSGCASGTCTKMSVTPSGSVTCISCRPHGSCLADRAISTPRPSSSAWAAYTSRT